MPRAPRETAFRQASFAGGEIDPRLYGRTDLERYYTSLAECQNFIVHPAGGASFRPGTKLVAEVKDSTRTVRLAPFVFSDGQTYVLEIGHLYTRIHYRGAPLLDDFSVLIELATPWGEPQLQSLQWAQLNDVLRVTAPGSPPHEIRRRAHRTWEHAPYMTVRPVNPPTGITHTNGWGGADTTHPEEEWSWVVTSVDKDGHESLGSDPLTIAPAVLYQDRLKPRFTWTPPASGNTAVAYNVYRGRNGVYGLVGATKGAVFIDDAFAPDYSSGPPLGTDPFAEEIPVVGGTYQEAVFGTPSASEATKLTAPDSQNESYTFHYSISWFPAGEVPSFIDAHITLLFQVDTGGGYVTKRTVTHSQEGGRPPFVLKYVRAVTIAGTVGSGSKFRVVAQAQSLCTPSYDRVSWNEAEAEAGLGTISYPRAVCYSTQRLVFGGFDVLPSTIRASRVGDYTNFDRSEPLKEDDSLELQLASLQFDGILALVPMTGLFVFTTGAVWLVRLGVSEFSADVVDHEGAGPVSPIRIGQSLLYATARARTVREIAIDTSGSGFASGRNLAVLAGHLFLQHGIRDWAYMGDPDTVLWAARDDGALLGMTYSRELETWAWHRHDSAGDAVEQLCSVPEPGEYALYMVARRTINGATKRYVERMEPLYRADVREAVFLDSALQYNGTNPDVSLVALRLSGAFNPGESGTVETRPLIPAQPPVFDSGWVGNRVRLTDAATGKTCKVEITAVASAFSATYLVITAVPAELQAIPTARWGRMLPAASGLGHLEGRTVGLLVDGGAQAPVVVSGGVAQLGVGVFGEKITVGLPYTGRIVSLSYLPDPRLAFDPKISGRIGIEVDRWRGLHVGELGGALAPVSERDVLEGYDVRQPRRAFIEVRPETSWTTRPAVVVEQREPLPATLLAIVGEAQVGGD